jgi:hypothetical protein
LSKKLMLEGGALRILSTWSWHAASGTAPSSAGPLGITIIGCLFVSQILTL